MLDLAAYLLAVLQRAGRMKRDGMHRTAACKGGQRFFEVGQDFGDVRA